MEYLVKISEKARILELKRRNMKKTDSDILYAVCIKEDTTYMCLHFTEDHEGTRFNTPYLEESYTPYSITTTKVIKEEFEKLGFLEINDGSFIDNTQPGTLYDEFNRLSRIDNDLFTYEIEVPESFECNKQADCPAHNDLGDYDKKIIEQWLDLKYGNHMTMDVNVKNEARGDDEVELSDKEPSDPNDENLTDECEVAEIFRIETNMFDFETLTCKAFKEFNYLLQIDPDVLTKDIKRYKSYEIYKNGWIYEWNKDVPWVQENPWIDNGVWNHTVGPLFASPFNYKSGLSGMGQRDSLEE
ncbi:hypothetical protein Tco_0744665 [Tanacetum coccineum]